MKNNPDRETKSKAKRVKFWSRVSRNGKEQWRMVEGVDESGVPEVCWRLYNGAFWKMLRQGKLNPADPMACYQEGCAAMVKAAGKVKAQGEGKARVIHCSPVTYITSAGLGRIRQFVREDVAKMRETQSQMFDQCRVNGELDVQAYVESVPSLLTFDAALTDDLAKVCIEETLAKCSIETRVGLRVYLEKDLCVKEAADALNMKRETFSWHRDKKWFPEFRANCTWRW